MTKVTTASSFFIVATSILLASQLTEASSAASSSSSLMPHKSDAFGNDSLLKPKRTRRRRRNRNKIELPMKSGSTELVTSSTHVTPLATNHVSEDETKLVADDIKSMVIGKNVHNGNMNITTTPRKRKRRRRTTTSKDEKVNIATYGPSDDSLDLQVENGADSQQHMTEIVQEEGEFHSKIIYPTKRLAFETSDSFFSQHFCESDTSEKITIINKSHHQNTYISPRSTDFKEEKTNATTTDSEDYIQQTQTELRSDSCTPTFATVFQSSSESKNSLVTEINNRRTVTFQTSHQRKQRSVQIKTISRPEQSNGSIPKTTSSLDKRTNEPKLSSQNQMTGKGGECLRRIKREWKDAVRMGIAYDWTNMRTVTKSESSKINDYVRLGPFRKNLLRWHFSVMGPANSVYEHGIYHGRVLLPKDYPGSPPRVQVRYRIKNFFNTVSEHSVIYFLNFYLLSALQKMLTPSGRFVPGEDICLSASNYHPETWTPRWTVLSLVDALRLHMLTAANEIGGVVASDEKRRSYADKSRSWCLPGVVDHGRMVADGIFSVNKDITECLELNDSKQNETSLEMPVDTDEMNNQIDAKLNGHMTRSNLPPSVDVAFVAAKSKKAKPTKRSRTTVVKSPGAKSSKKAISPEDRVLDAEDVNTPLQRSMTKWLVIEIIKLPLRILSILVMLISLLESKLMGILDRM